MNRPSAPPFTRTAVDSDRSVSIIGGGVIGLCVALSLQEQGFGVTVFDAEDSRPPPSWGNAGRIATEVTEPLASLATLRSLPSALFCRGGAAGFPPAAIGSWFPFGLRLIRATGPRRFERGKSALRSLLNQALPAWKRRLDELNASPLMIENGHYSVWEDANRYRRGVQALRADAGASTVSDPDPAELSRLRSLIRAPLAGALHFSGTASVSDPDALLATLRSSLLERGGTLERRRIDVPTALDSARRVVVAAGVHSGSILRPFVPRVPLIAERGYHLQQSDPDWPADLPPLLFEEREVVVTRFHSFMRATSFVEFSRPEAPPDPRKWARLRRHLSELGLPFRASATEWVGSRPTLPDYLPAIGRSKRDSRVFYAFGHQHLGLTLAAITGELIAASMSGSTAPLDMAPFDLDRFD